jgi:thiamine biosynthesis lipoprotein
VIGHSALRRYRSRFTTMGCPAEICLYAPSANKARAGFKLAEAECRRLDLKYSHYRADSYLVHLQKQASLHRGCPVDEETASLLDMAAVLYEESGGRFDITAGGLTALWERCEDLPGAAEIDAVLSRTGWHRVRWDGAALRLPPGLRLDLGGLVKEYAADRAAHLLKVSGFDSGFVELGGDLNVLGPHPGGAGWHIGIRNPRGPGVLAGLNVRRGGLATSGDFERCTIIDGLRYGHIIDPVSGWPVRGLALASVVAPSCLLAGAVSTLAMLTEAGEGLDFLAESGLPWLAHDGGNVHTGSAEAIHPFSSTRVDFHWADLRSDPY